MEKCGLSLSQSSHTALASKYKTTASLISGKELAKLEMQRGNFHGTCGRVKRTAEIVQEANVDGLIWNYTYTCRPSSLPSLLLKHFVEKETGIPVLSLETDLADSRTYSAGALQTRVETFAETLRARKTSRKA